MKKSLLFLFFCVCAYWLNAQITTNETPPSFNVAIKRSLNTLSTQVLPAPDLKQVRAEDEIYDSQLEGLRFAYPMMVNYTLTNSGIWQKLPDGSRLWRLKVKIPGALSTHTFYDQFYLPEGGKFFVYNENTRQCIGAITSEFLQSAISAPIEFATGLIYGETVIFEYHQLTLVTDTAIISISRIDYGYRNIPNPHDILSFSGECQVNVNCSEGDDWQKEKRAVALIAVPLSGGSLWFTGALVNTTILKSN